MAQGLYPIAAAAEARVAWAVGTRWFRQAGGMPQKHLAPSVPPLSGRSLAFAEREHLALLRAQGFVLRECARQLGQSPSTFSRASRRNAATRSGALDDTAIMAQWHANYAALRPRQRTRRSASMSRTPCRRAPARPHCPLASGPRVTGAYGLHARDRQTLRHTQELTIGERPAEIEDRAEPGHWEEDLILGLSSSALGTLVERTTRFTLTLHLPRMAAHGRACGGRAHYRDEAGSPLAGHGATAVRSAFSRVMHTLPAQLRRWLTWDQGSETAEHVRLRTDVGLAILFCDPESPSQRGTNDNTNGLLCQYFPRRTDRSAHSAPPRGCWNRWAMSRQRGWKRSIMKECLRPTSRSSDNRVAGKAGAIEIAFVAAA